MKKLIPITFLCLLLTTFLSACSDNDNSPDDTEIANAIIETESSATEDVMVEEVADDGNTIEAVSDVKETESTYFYNTTLYSDDFIEIELVSISTENAIFDITNNSDLIIEISCEYFQLDGVEYSDKDIGYSTPTLIIGSKTTREYQFCNDTSGKEVNFEITNPDCTNFSAVFIFYYEDDEGNFRSGYADIPNVEVKSS